MRKFSALLALCAGNSLVTGEFPLQRPMTRSFDVFFDLRLNKPLSKQSRLWGFETQSRSLLRNCNYKPALVQKMDCRLVGDNPLLLFHWFCKCTPPWMFLPLDIPSEYRPEHVTFGLLCVTFKFPSRLFCRRVPGFATDCPCGVWCRGLTTCLLYVGPPLEF